MNILVTGASGFVGSAASLELSLRDYSVRVLTRTHRGWPPSITSFNSPFIHDIKYSHPAFKGVDCVLHLAGRAHVMRERHSTSTREFMDVNCFATLAFARQAALAGVQRFIFVSSIKVNGEYSSPSSPFTPESLPDPSDPYAISKYQAELGLFEIASETGMEVVIVRPPLIYGPGVKGNLRLLMKLLASNIPLPFGMITNNRRSLLSLPNFIDFLDLCIRHKDAPGNVLLVSDQFDVSTRELVTRLGLAMGLTPRLFPFPPVLLKAASLLVCQRSIYQRLCGSLVLDSSSSSRLLGWSPPLTFDDGLRRTTFTFGK